MATARGKTSPDVALLIRRVQMDERFKVEEKSGSNKINILGPEGQPLIVSMDADSSDMRRAERALERMGLRQAEQPAPTTRQRVTTKPATDPYPSITVYEKAKKVHKNATDYAKATGVPIGLYDGVEFYVIDDKPLKYFIGKAYPKIKHYVGPGGTQEIYDFLRSTGNYARERQDDDTSAIILRVSFAEVGGPVQWRSPRGPVSEWQKERERKERKVTAHEAGEDREPEPVTVTTVEERERAKQAEADKAALEAIVAAGDANVDDGGEPGVVIDLDAPAGGQPGIPTPEDLRLLAEARAREEALTCPECTPATGSKAFVARNPQGLSAHRKSKHGVDGSTYTPSVLGKVTADSPIAEVAMAFEMMREALGKVTEQADHTACEGTLAEARKEEQFQRADAQVQRQRAERAEETLHLIWLAFSTMAQHKAVAEILPLLPPLKED